MRVTGSFLCSERVSINIILTQQKYRGEVRSSGVIQPSEVTVGLLIKIRSLILQATTLLRV